MSENQPPVLSYGGSSQPKWVTVHKYLSEFEAHLAANELEANGIRWQLFNEDVKSVLGWYGGFISIRLAVPNDEEVRAKQILARHAASDVGDLEPAEREDPNQPLEIADEEGNRATWKTAAVFESARALHEAAMVLESAHLSVLLPRLVPKGEAPPADGPRFVLRVQDDDIERAQKLLRRATEDDAEEELRCPKCGAFSVHEGTDGLGNWLLNVLGASHPKICECMKCHYKGAPAEFGKKS